MDLLTALFLAFAMCVMLASVVAGAYALLNKPAAAGTTLLSPEELEALAGQIDSAKNDVHYSNVLDARIGFDSSHIIKSSTLEPADCQTLCTGTTGCSGFQISGQNGCDLLSNLTTTYAFEETGYNVFTTPLYVPLTVFGAPNQGEVTGKDITAAPSPRPPSDVKTKHECAELCKTTGSACKSFSVSATEGCKLKSALNIADASLITSGDWNSYFTHDVKHSNDWSWKTPAPSPSPA